MRGLAVIAVTFQFNILIPQTEAQIPATEGDSFHVTRLSSTGLFELIGDSRGLNHYIIVIYSKLRH